MNSVPRGIRNNNPGNIKAGTWKFIGQTGIDEDGFRIFDTPEHGIKALEDIIRRYITMGDNTIRKIINKYAPPIENDTATYAEFVGQKARLNEDQVILFDDIDTIRLLTKAIIRYENGEQPYSDDMF